METTKQLTLQAIANSIDLLPFPDPLTGADTVILPQLPDGYAVTIAHSSDETLVSEDGHITRGERTAAVTLTLKVTELSTGSSLLTRPLLLPIYRVPAASTVTQEELHRAKASFEELKYGLFVHYVPGTVYADGSNVESIDMLADCFDAVQFAADMQAFGVEYVVFTAWHWRTLPLFPSMTNKRWRDDRRAARGKSYADRDVIADLSQALALYGIPLYLYVHPSDGHDFDEEDMRLSGWTDDDDDRWNRYANELLYELCDRYEGRIQGLWIDGLFHRIPTGDAQETLKRHCTAIDPRMILTLNVGLEESKHIEYPMAEHNGAEYRCWEHNHTDDLEAVPLTRNQTAIIISSQWYTITAKDEDVTVNPAEEIFRYTVGQGSISTSGGFLASVGCYPNRPEDHLQGQLWQKGIKEILMRVKAYMTAIDGTFLGTLPGRAFPTPAGKAVHELSFVSTESKDGTQVFIHVLHEVGKLTLPVPEDGSAFLPYAEVIQAGKERITLPLTVEQGTYTVLLPEKAASPLTVVILKRT